MEACTGVLANSYGYSAELGSEMTFLNNMDGKRRFYIWIIRINVIIIIKYHYGRH